MRLSKSNAVTPLALSLLLFGLSGLEMGCVPPSNRPAQPRHDGRLLFQARKSATQLTLDRDQFLDETYFGRDQIIINPDLPFPDAEIPQELAQAHSTYSLNSSASSGFSHYRGLPIAPIIFPYQAGTDVAKIAIQLPHYDFNSNLPAEVQTVISQEDVNSLDIFISIQNYDGNAPFHGLNGFKPHVWAGNPRSVPFTGTIWDGALRVGVAQADYPIEGQIPRNSLRPFHFSIHDNTLSPVAPTLHLDPARLDLSFWSITVDPRAHRAAATLHFIAAPAPHGGRTLSEQIEDHIENSIRLSAAHGGNALSLRTLVAQLIGDPNFNGLPFVQKLQELIR